MSETVEAAPKYRAHVFHLTDNPYFGTGWTWCREIDGDPKDNSDRLPHCESYADARDRACAWLASMYGETWEPGTPENWAH